MFKKIKFKHVAVYESILDEFSVGHYGIKVKVSLTHVKFNHLIFQITSRWLFICREW